MHADGKFVHMRAAGKGRREWTLASTMYATAVALSAAVHPVQPGFCGFVHQWHHFMPWVISLHPASLHLIWWHDRAWICVMS